MQWLDSVAGPGYAAALLWTFAALVLLVIVLVIIRLVRLGEFAASSTNRFDEDDLAAANGSTKIPGGTARVLRFRTRLACGRQVPESVAADIRFEEFSGRKNSITVSALFVSDIGNPLFGRLP